LADARCELHVPLAVVTFGVGFVGEYAGRADFGEIAGKFAFERAAFGATEVNVVVCTINAEVFATGVILVITHAAIAGDAAVHLVVDERAEVLVLVRALGEAIAACVVTGHHGHVLQVAVAAFFADRAIVRVVGHQPFDDAFANLHGFVVGHGEERAVGCGGHAGHGQRAAFVGGVRVLFDRALAAGTDTAERRMPAEIGNIETERETGLQ